MLGALFELVQRAECVGEAEPGFADVGEVLFRTHVQARENRRQPIVVTVPLL